MLLLFFFVIFQALEGITKVMVGAGGSVQYFNSTLNSEALHAIAAADVAIVVVGTSSGEGTDRPTLALGNEQDQLVSSVAALLMTP